MVRRYAWWDERPPSGAAMPGEAQRTVGRQHMAGPTYGETLRLAWHSYRRINQLVVWWAGGIGPKRLASDLKAWVGQNKTLVLHQIAAL